MHKKVLIALKMSAISGQEKLAGIFRYLGATHNWDITLVRTSAELTPARIKKAIKDGYHGFIISLPHTEKAMTVLSKSNLPTVVMDIFNTELECRNNAIAFIRNDPTPIGKAAANYLLSTGRCRSYAFVDNPEIAVWSSKRLKAFREELHDHGIWCHELSSPEGLNTLTKPVGVFAANDDRGYDVLEYCRKHEINVPEDILVIGIDNDTLICENCRPPLSSIQPDFNEEGFLAAKLLTEMMNDAKSPTDNQSKRILWVGVKEIIRRGSTADISNAGKLVQKALSYLRNNACRNINVNDVATHLGCSRRLADLRFRELQGESIGAMLIKLRLEMVMKLLKTTREPIDTIALQCGYQKNPNSLKNLFKKRFGISMRDYRERESLLK